MNNKKILYFDLSSKAIQKPIDSDDDEAQRAGLSLFIKYFPNTSRPSS